MSIENKLDQILSAVLVEHPGVFLVNAAHKQLQHEYTIDGDKALGIYDIADIARKVNKIAEEELEQENYSIDVSSPGADSDLVLLRQYPKHIGREFFVQTAEETFSGKLLSVEDQTLTFEKVLKLKPKKTESIKIEFNQIIKAHIILSFK